MAPIEPQDERVQAWLIVFALVASALVFWRGATAPFSVVKFTIVAVSAAVIVAIGAARVLRSGQFRLPVTVQAAAVAMFLVLGAVAVLTSDVIGISLFGRYGRNSGYLLYLASGILFFAALRCYEVRRRLEQTVLWVVGAGGVVALYGLVQRAGWDPLSWTSLYGPKDPFSTLGNTNFVSGYLATTVPLALWIAIGSRERWRQILGTAAFLASGAAIIATESSQGVVAALAGVAVVALAFILNQRRETRRRLLTAFGVVVVIASAVGAFGVAGRGPLERLNDTGLDYRRHYWGASASMVADHPVFGVGFDMWADFFRAERSADAAAGNFAFVTDEPHSVPLAMATGGGIPLALAYLAFVVATGWALLRGLAATDGRQRLLLGSVGGAWVAYQVQSFVSIDIPAFPPLHFVLAAMVLLLSGLLRWRTVPVRPLISAAPPTKGARRTRVTVRSRVPGWVAGLVVAVLTVPLMLQLVRPLRADVTAKDDVDASSVGGSAALHKLADAIKFAPWESEYWSLGANFWIARDRLPIALKVYEGALEENPRSFVETLNAARTAKAAGLPRQARRWYKRALELEPHAVELRLEAADFYLALGLNKAVKDVVEPNLRGEHANAEAWRFFGDALLAEDDVAGARQAYERSARIDPAGRGAGMLEQLDATGR